MATQIVRMLEFGGAGLATILALLAYRLIRDVIVHHKRPPPTTLVIIGVFMFFEVLLVVLCVLLWES